MFSLDRSGTLRARAPKGLTPSRLRIARGVAIVIGISLSIVRPIEVEASNLSIKYVKELAKEQLTDKQELCHHEIVSHIREEILVINYSIISFKPFIKAITTCSASQ